MSTATKSNRGQRDSGSHKSKKRTSHSKKHVKGYELDLFKDQTKALLYSCKLCKKVARSPCELSCGESDDDDHEVLYCESCISSYLTANSQHCPINSKHSNAGYIQTRIVRKHINNLRVYCPNNHHRSNCGEVEEGKKAESSSNDDEDNQPNDSPCNESGCHWSGKLQKLSAHLKVCKFNSKHCKICNILCAEANINEHNKTNMAKHITLLSDKIDAVNQANNGNHGKYMDTSSPLSPSSPSTVLSNEKISQYEQQIADLMSANAKLKKEVSTMKSEYNEWKISFNIEASKKDFEYKSEHEALRKLIKQQSQQIELLSKQHQELATQCEHDHAFKRTGSPSPFGIDLNLSRLDEDDLETDPEDGKEEEEAPSVEPEPEPASNPNNVEEEHQNGNEHGNKNDSENEDDREGTPQTVLQLTRKSRSNTKRKPNKLKIVVPKLKAPKSVPVPQKQTTMKFLGKPPLLKRTASMKFFHPELPEPYHPKPIKYEMYHPKPAQEVWVSKTKGSVAKLERFPCCGSAKDGALYLVLMKPEKGKKHEEPIYMAQKHNLPKNWSEDIYLGCKPNKKKNKDNMSHYLCCSADIMSAGCRKRYKCCRADVNDKDAREGCKVGWGC